MAFQMVYTQHGLVQSSSQCTRYAGAYQQGPCQAWATCIRHHIHLVQINLGIFQDFTR